MSTRVAEEHGESSFCADESAALSGVREKAVSACCKSAENASAELHRGAVSKQEAFQGVVFFLLLLISSVLA